MEKEVLMESLTFEIFKRIVWRSEILETTFKRGLVEIGIRKSIPEYKNVYNVRYWAIYFILRWPKPVRIRFDLAKYLTGGRLPEHIDEYVRKEVRQFNFIFTLKKAKLGGELLSEKFVYNGSRLKIIEVSRYKHEVTLIEEGQRIVANFQIAFSPEYTVPPPF